MPVPSSINELSTNPASNSPDGTSEGPGTLDNYQRAHAAFIAQLRDGQSTIRTDLASTASGKGAEMVGFKQSGTGAVATTVQAKLREFVSVKDFGAVADASVTTGTDNTAAFQAAIDHCASTGQSLYMPAGRYFFNGGKLTIASGLVVFGDGANRTVLVFGGSPSKEVITRAVWRAEYDTGDYTNNSDAAVAWGIRVTSQFVRLKDFLVTTNHDPSVDYPLPFNSATDFPTSGYEYGVVVQAPNVDLDSLAVLGVWSDAAGLLDGSGPAGGIGDGFNTYNCDFSGHWGFKVQGPQGQPLGGDDYAELTSSDTRCGGGISDVNHVGCRFDDTSGSLRLFIDGVRKGVRRSTTGGSYTVNGQVSGNSANRIQGHRAFNCRFASADPNVYKLNYINRMEFFGCHSEFRAGFYNSDGVTLLVGSDCSIVVTENARRIVYFGGEKSGEADGRVLKNTSDNVRIVSEFGYEVASVRRLAFDTLSDAGTWTPSLLATTPGTPAYSSQFGYYTRIGNLVHVWGRIMLSSNTGMSGNVTIEGLPFVVANLSGAYDPSVTFGALSQVTSANLGGVANNNATNITLLTWADGGTLGSLTAAGLTATSRFDFHVCYMTSDA